MQIIAINQSRKPQQVWLKFSDESLLPLKIDDLVNLKLVKFIDISTDAYHSIQAYSAKYLLLEYCLRQIAISPKIRKILEQKLKIYNLKLVYKYSFDRDLLASLVNPTIDKTASLGLLDDQTYIDYLVRKYPKKSSTEINYLLRRLGLNYRCQPDRNTEIVKISRLLEKKYQSVNLRDYHDKSKVIANLIHKGFPLELIKAAIDETLQLR